MILPNLPDVLRQRIADEIAEQSRQIANGAAADHADYKHRVGQIRGLGRVIEILDDITTDKERT